MLALGLVLNTVGIGLFCWLVFALAVYALPFFVALNIGMMAFHGGAGVIGALLIGIAAGALTTALGQTAVAVTRSGRLRVAIAIAFAVPAAIAGYNVMLALSQIGIPSLAWREVVACLGAVCIGGTAWTRLSVFMNGGPPRAGRVGGAIPTGSHGCHARDDPSSPSSSNRFVQSILLRSKAR
ncbi:hypothetical protein [Bradyrhizobium macuxiense]|uniref:hypothetical protein n=1 Tax=Bradyrhizobium macuxiense TaxID=1755647 RepID=UPI000AB52A9C|nr:hypothetical protein [Bradyrhizobium macuxiense]